MLLRDNHSGYISRQDYEDDQRLLLENAPMKSNCARASARGGGAFLTWLMRCTRCGRMTRVYYGMGTGNAHRYHRRGDDGYVGAGLSVQIAGARIDPAVALGLQAVSDRAVEAAIFAAGQIARSTNDVIAAVERNLKSVLYEAGLADRRHELVDPAKRHVARELEASWNAALKHVAELESRVDALRATAAARLKIDRGLLLQLAPELPGDCNAPSADIRISNGCSTF